MSASASSPENPHWLANLFVCVGGSFITIIAMTLLLPVLPLYIKQLEVEDAGQAEEWAGIAFGVTFLAAAIVAPFWGRLGDAYGRKLMLVRASLGMSVAMALIGFAHNVEQLVALRALVGFAGGYSSGSMILVAAQTPKARSGWALGLMSSGIMAGNVAGPLIGGALAPLIGFRAMFEGCGAVIFLAFLATLFLIREVPKPKTAAKAGPRGWAAIADKRAVAFMLFLGFVMMVAIMSIEPIIAFYVAEIDPDPTRVPVVAGLAMSAAALGSVLSAPPLGRLADRIGHRRVLIGALTASALLLIPQAFVATDWQLVSLRFLMGLALGAIMPGMTAILRRSAPDDQVGRLLGLSTSIQYIGQVLGPSAGGAIGAHEGMRAVFLATAVLMGAATVATVAFAPGGKRVA